MSDQSDQKKEKMARAKKCLKTCGIVSGIGLVVFGVTVLGLYFWFKGGSKQQTEEEIQELQKYLALPGVQSGDNYIAGTYVSFFGHLKCCPIKLRVFHQNESCLAWPHPPSSYEGRRVQRRQLLF